ncbi:MAG: hypothetical protein MI922_28255 [Bacteroidales bacterium]|nr:hypothetical protein [Bacteroidales bacterium]
MMNKFYTRIGLKKVAKLLIAFAVTGILIYLSNLFWLRYTEPPLRSNHVGLSILSVIIFWGLVFGLKFLTKKR